MRIQKILPLALLALAPAAAAAEPADGADDRWLPYLGCWEPVMQQGAADHVVCIRESGADAVTISTWSAGTLQSEQTLRTDGSAQPVSDETCSGTESARWSDDGRRVYLSSDLACGEGRLGRESAGVIAMLPSGHWVDIQAIGVSGQHAVRAVRYAPASRDAYPAGFDVAASSRALEAARLYAAASPGLAGIEEAAAVLPPAAVEAMIAALDVQIAIDAEALERFADAGVPGSTIDVLVAAAHPEHFGLALVGDEPAPGERMGPTVVMPSYHDPFMYDRWNRYGYSSYYSPFGSPYGNPYWGYNGGTRIIVVDRDELTERNASLVKGRGYTRPGSGSSTGTARPRDPDASWTRSGAQPAASSRPATTTSPQPARTSEPQREKAKPRPPAN